MNQKASRAIKLKKSLQRKSILQLRKIAAMNNVDKFYGKKNELVDRIVEKIGNKSRIKRFWLAHKTNIVYTIVSATLGFLISVPFSKQAQNELNRTILVKDEMEKTLQILYRMSTKTWDNYFPIGYAIFSSQNKEYVIGKDTVFSTIIKGNISPRVKFNYQTNKVLVKLNQNFEIDYKHQANLKENRSSQEVNIPPPGYFQMISGYGYFIDNQECSLYFGILDDTRGDEVYLFGFKNVGVPDIYSRYRRN